MPTIGEAVRIESAAPIAPAAAPDEVIEELEKALRSLRNAFYADAIRDLFSDADAALARAEEYRKGAKNATD